MRKLAFSIVISSVVAASALAACGDDDGGTTGTSNPTGAGNNGGNSSDGGGGSTGSNNGGGGSTGEGGGSTTPGGFCANDCEADADCCPDGVPNCPGDYPVNYSCNADGFCAPPECSAQEECTFNGALPDYDCFQLEGANAFSEDGVLDTCLEGCAADEDCTAPATCIGEDMDGDKYCTVEPGRADPCETDEDCGGYGVCDTDSGACYCDDNGDCTGTGVDACYDP